MSIYAHYRAMTHTGSSIEAKTDNLPMDVHKLVVLAMTKPEEVQSMTDALKAILVLLPAMKEVLRISDRKHEAWDAAKDAIAKIEGGAA